MPEEVAAEVAFDAFVGAGEAGATATAAEYAAATGAEMAGAAGAVAAEGAAGAGAGAEAGALTADELGGGVTAAEATGLGSTIAPAEVAAPSVAPEVMSRSLAVPSSGSATMPASLTPADAGMAGSAVEGSSYEEGMNPYTAGAPSGITDYLSKGAKALGLTTAQGNLAPGTALTAGALGLNAYNQTQNNKRLGDMQNQLKQTVSPLKPTQQKLIDQFNSGTLSADDSQAISDWVTQSKAQLRQQYASSGMGSSSQAAQAEAAIDRQAVAMRDQALKNYLSSALSTTGVMTGPYSTLAQQQISADQGLQSAAANVFKAVGAQQSAAG